MPTKHFRAPIFDTFRKKSPFQGLWEHAAKVQECIAALRETLDAFTANQHDKVPGLAATVSALELQADEIKSNIRNHLPANVRMPVDKPLFLQALAEQDRILDEAEDAAIWMSMRKTEVSPEIADGFRRLLAKVIETVDAYERAVANTHDLVETGFVKREREEQKQLIHRVHELEHETDVLSRELSALLLEPAAEKKLGPIAVYHLLKLTLQLSKVADHAENAGDRLRAMLSR
jgi:predicted phosphate transport protein (TIGR00153 family)